MEVVGEGRKVVSDLRGASWFGEICRPRSGRGGRRGETWSLEKSDLVARGDQASSSSALKIEDSTGRKDLERRRDQLP